VVTLHDRRGIKGSVVNERVNFGSFVLFFGKKLLDSSGRSGCGFIRNPEKPGSEALDQVLLFVMKRRRLKSSYWPERLSSSSLTRNLR
jgi:hypothetical protein